MSTEKQTEVKTGFKKFNDFKSADEVDLSKVELVRGKTPPDIKERCLQLCKDYLSGNWCQQTLDTVEVRRITGGLMNQLYYCGINEPNSSEEVPQEVAIRLYGPNIFEHCDKERVRDLVISLMFSEEKLGPKIYGLFEGGQIQKYYKHRQFKLEEQKNPVLVKKIFQTMAKIHSLEAPLKKDPLWFYDLMIRFYEIAINKYQIKQLAEEYNCVTLKTKDLKTEIDWIKGVILNSNSPVVFTHNDYRSSNLLITEPNDELVICDYDISGYSYRGYDFLSLYREWGREQFDHKELDDFPVEDSVYKPLLEIYIEECVRIHGKSYLENEVNTAEHILEEIKLFGLFGNLFGTVFCLKMDEKDDDFMFNKKLCFEFAEKAFKYYFKLKDIVLKMGLIEETK